MPPEGSLDRALLARQLQSKMRAERLSIRVAAAQIGCSPATLGRLLQGAGSPNYPEGVTLIRAANWLGKSLSYFDLNRRAQSSTITDVETHLRALPDLPKDAAEGLIAMVRAVYDERRIKTPDKKGLPSRQS
jgi:transcriptional regulator with XRE-family HTH domain